ncbi:diphosphomevalonate decarboxylase [Trypanosoma rangeli]|uniref:Diphosphomevalonate decarboxylase n=1 Tax=Trypanosoma rangeli TaxID=5698 RepID=A0A422NWH3_TRYRA|nr:diphosphomevalonate decarboxylase [Trypanosoma rangeli]RNF09840.1 diphosphomevalonate decarboxylase [Trypanosoma rangeli]|eukprot:RNF09840.1 diphosphomevalonate decarboxylase [Trypanosoma rangeli]
MAALEATVEAPINIAFIKYWGKREGGEELILPVNDSFSITLATQPLRSKTSVALRDDLDRDTLILNGKQSDIQSNPRVQSVLAHVRNSCPEELKSKRVYIVSENNFPTAAGMASSASGYCALAAALVRVFKSTANVSMLARLGSGSACRSALGGFVVWHKGVKPDGSDSVATQFVDENHWPEMQVLCAVLQGEKKDTSSTAGMQQSLRTSPLMPERITTTVPERMRVVSEAIKAKDFSTFAEIAMRESDDLQEICATTLPRIQYATEDSYAMIRLVRAYNAKRGSPNLAYTFDAGANCFLFVLKRNLPEAVAVLMQHFPTPYERFCFNDAALLREAQGAVAPSDCRDLIDYPKKPLVMLLQSPVGAGVRYLAGAERPLHE